MTDLLVRLFVKNNTDVNNFRVRQSYGLLSGQVGICINVSLCILKLLVGFASGAVSIIADGINNLSDAGSSIVTILGLKLSAKPADAEHPYGHGRIEYIAAMIIAGVVIAVGVQLIFKSVEKFMEPEPVDLSLAAVVVMSASILLKLWMGSFNKELGRRTKSPVFSAVAADSMSDCVATSVVILCLAIHGFTGWDLDAAAGIFVGIFIIYSGWRAAIETLQSILGKQTDPELIKSIVDTAMEDRRILGVHDVIVHSYGAGKVFASLHIEVPSTMKLVKAHFVATQLETALEKRLNVNATIHVDPKVVGNARFDAMTETLANILRDISPQLSMHDLHIIQGKKLVFDVEVPYSFPLEDRELTFWINKRLKEKEALYEAEVKLDRV